MAFVSLQSIPQGQSDTTQLNAAIDAVNRLASGLGQSATVLATSNMTPTATLADVPGCTVSVTVSGVNAFAHVDGTASFGIAATDGGHTLAVDLVVDGVAQSGEILHTAANITTFETPSRSWTVPLAPGAHTLKLQARNDGTSSSQRVVQATHTGLTVTLFDIV